MLWIWLFAKCTNKYFTFFTVDKTQTNNISIKQMYSFARIMSTENMMVTTNIDSCASVTLREKSLFPSDSHIFQSIDNSSSYVIAAFNDRRVYKENGVVKVLGIIPKSVKALYCNFYYENTSNKSVSVLSRLTKVIHFNDITVPWCYWKSAMVICPNPR